VPAQPRPRETSGVPSPADAALQQAIADIRRQYGHGALMSLGDSAPSDIPCIPTGAPSLDIALGGGIPAGRITEVFGPEGCGKTTLALHVIASAQRSSRAAVLIDAEHALDPRYARAIGVDLSALLLAQPHHGEEAVDIAERLARTGRIGLIVVDSVPALIPRAELDGEPGASFVGSQARLMSQAMRKLTGSAARAGTALLFINQLREKVGVMYGPSETTPGGRALKFFSSLRVELRRTETLKQGDRIIGHRVRARAIKNKIAPPFREADIDILYGRGIRTAASLLDAALERGILAQKGSWISLEDRQLGQGREAAVSALESDPDLAATVLRALLAASAAPPGHDS
jgi:recombination protein RecA